MDKKDKYNEEPVFYCRKCKSLKILGVDHVLYCGDCGSTEIDKSLIQEWEKIKNSKH